jgi:ornithine cyclodeaminase/alanine dehydrogenase-like protein (mu-crystallin family)
MRIVSAHDVGTLLATTDVTAVVADALAAYSSGAAHVPARLRVVAGRDSRESLVMPGYLSDPPILGLKVVNGFAATATDPTVTHAVVLVFDPETGQLDGVVEAARLTAVRTAAMTRLAFRFAAPPDVRVVALIGSGVQARAHGELLAEAFPDLREVRVHSRTPRHAEQFAGALVADGLPAWAVPSAQAAVTSADVVVAATTATEPVFEDRWLAPGALVCGVGTHTPEAAEIPPDTVGRAGSVLVDTRVGGVHGAGDVSLPVTAGAVSADAIAELGELVLGTRTVTRSDDGVTVFKSVGTAAADLPLAAMLVVAARAQGLGVEVEFG